MLGDRIWFTWLIEKDEDLEDLDKYIIQLDKTTTGDLPKAGPEKSGEHFPTCQTATPCEHVTSFIKNCIY